MADINIFLLFKTGLFFHRRPHHQQVDARRTTKTTKCFHVRLHHRQVGTGRTMKAVKCFQGSALQTTCENSKLQGIPLFKITTAN